MLLLVDICSSSVLTASPKPTPSPLLIIATVPCRVAAEVVDASESCAVMLVLQRGDEEERQLFEGIHAFTTRGSCCMLAGWI